MGGKVCAHNDVAWGFSSHCIHLPISTPFQEHYLLYQSSTGAKIYKSQKLGQVKQHRQISLNISLRSIKTCITTLILLLLLNSTVTPYSIKYKY